MELPNTPRPGNTNIQFRYVQNSRNITFNENDTKLFPIPNEDEDDVLLEGENIPCEQSLPIPPTPQMEATLIPNLSEITLMPETEVRQSMRLTNRPNYRLLNDPDADRALVSHEIVTEPGNYAQAMARTDAPIWIEAMKTEMNQHQETGTWALVDLPPD